MRGLISSTATRSPSIDTSSSSPRTVLPNSWPVGIECNCMRNDVLAVGREGVHHRDAAARAERRALDVAHLRAGARHLVGGGGRRRLRIADRERADAVGGAQVAFHQRRREALRVGDVVEAGADLIRRQERADVDVEREQRVHGARVLGAIQALERAMAGIRIERRGLIEPRLHRGGERVDDVRLRDAARRRAASCPSAACESSSRRLRRPAPSWPTFDESNACNDSPPALFLLRSL